MLKLKSNTKKKGNIMGIATAVQKGSFIYMYDEKGKQLGIAAAGSGKFVGYSATFVCVQKGSFVYTYNEKGSQIGTVSIGSGVVQGCTGTINVKKGSFIYMYDEKGHPKGTRSV